ncbi:MAG: two-component system response regulator UvrY [Pseudomonadota bacterium]
MITVLLVDDHELVRAGLSRLLGDVPGIRVIAEASNGEEAIKLAKEKRPQVVLMDVRMPGMGGLEATRKMAKIDKNIKVIVLTVYDTEPFPTKLLQAGAAGYLTKDSDIHEIVNAIKTVSGGKHYLRPEIAQQLALRSFSDFQDSPLESLSERELQIMVMITSGQKIQEISDTLCLSPKTINGYRYRLFEKLNIQNDVELTHFALRHGLIEASAISDTEIA